MPDVLRSASHLLSTGKQLRESCKSPWTVPSPWKPEIETGDRVSLCRNLFSETSEMLMLAPVSKIKDTNEHVPWRSKYSRSSLEYGPGLLCRGHFCFRLPVASMDSSLDIRAGSTFESWYSDIRDIYLSSGVPAPLCTCKI